MLTEPHTTSSARTERRTPLTTQSPIRLLVVLAAAIFAGEVLVMLLFLLLPDLTGWRAAFVDATLLVILLFPALYRLAFLPLIRLLKEREKAERLIEQSRDELQKHVQEQTADLARANQILEAEIAECQRVECELKKLSAVVVHSANSILITDKEGAIEYVNPAFERSTGYTKAEAIGKTPRILKSGRHEAAFYERLWQTILSGQVFRAEVINRKKNGEYFYEEQTITPILDSGGNITHFASSTRNITERKRAEHAVQEAELRYRTLFEQSPAAVAVVDPASGTFLSFNDAFWRQLGYTREEMARMRVFDIEASKKPEEIRAHFESILRTGADQFEAQQRTKKGEVLDVLLSVRVIEMAGHKVFQGVFLDITERKRMEEALRRSEERFQLATRATNDFIWETNLVTGETWWSENMHVFIAGKTGAIQPSEQVWHNLIHPDDVARVKRIVAEALNKGASAWSAEYRVRRGDGNYASVLDRAYILHDATSKPHRLIGSMHDITERKQVEQERVRLIEELQESLAKVKQLSGLLPICAGCKKIRDDQGYWNQVESFIATHSKVTFTHGLCPECAKKYFPGIEPPLS